MSKANHHRDPSEYLSIVAHYCLSSGGQQGRSPARLPSIYTSPRNSLQARQLESGSDGKVARSCGIFLFCLSYPRFIRVFLAPFHSYYLKLSGWTVVSSPRPHNPSSPERLVTSEDIINNQPTPSKQHHNDLSRHLRSRHLLLPPAISLCSPRYLQWTCTYGKVGTSPTTRSCTQGQDLPRSLLPRSAR